MGDDEARKPSIPAWLRKQMESTAETAPVSSLRLPAFLDPNKTRVKRSQKHEERVAKEYGGRRLAASGALPNSRRDPNTSGADVRTDTQLIQHKGTERESIGVKRDWLRELVIEAKRRSLDPVLVVTFENEHVMPEEWVMVPKAVFHRLMANQGQGDDET